MRVLAVYNLKGGVGKTAAAVNLAHLSADEGRKTLLVDLDPQAAASFYLGVAPAVPWSSKRLAKGGKPLRRAIVSTDYPNLDVLPASITLRTLAVVLDDLKHPRRRLKSALDDVADNYDLAVLDAPAGIDLVAENVFRAAELVLVPVVPTTLSVHTLEQLDQFLADKSFHKGVLCPFLSMVDRRKSLHLQTMEHLRTERSDLLQSVIPFSSEVEKMGLGPAPLTAHHKGSRSGRAFLRFWEEVRDLVDRKASTTS